MEGRDASRALHNAAMYGDADTVKDCLNTGSSKYINIHDGFGMTPAMLAARSNGNSAECLKLLLSAGADVNTKGRNGGTILSFAADRGGAGCVQVLLDAAGSQHVNTADNAGQTPIMLAARSSGDNVKCLELLIKAGANIDKQDMFGSTALVYAAESGNARCIEALLHAGASKDVNVSNHQGQSAVMLAARAQTNNVECVQLLLNAGADIHTLDKYGSTVLAFAAQAGSVDCLQQFLDAGAYKYVNSSNLQGETLLMLASRSLGDHEECVERLLSLGASVHGQDSSGRTALSFAALNGNSKCVMALLSAGSDQYVNVPDFYGATPLMLTAGAMGDVECLKILLNAGAHCDTVDDDGNTALAQTGKFGNVKCLQALLDAGCGRLVNAANKYGQTALMIAAGAEGDYIECVQTLLAAGAHCDVEDSYGNTAAVYAADCSGKCLQALLDAGCHSYLNSPGKNGQTLLMLAATSTTDDTACLKALLKTGADVNVTDVHVTDVNVIDVNVTDINGYTALAHAAACGNIECLEELLDTSDKQHVNIPNMLGQTPLMLLAKLSADLVEHLHKLLNSGANVHVTDNQGYTALAYGAESGSVRCVQALLEAGGCQNMNSSTMIGQTLLMLASKSRGDNAECLENLLKLGADVDMKDKDGLSAVAHAAAAGNVKCVRVLLQAGGHVLVNASSRDGQTALMLAVRSEGDCVQCLQELLLAGADTDAEDQQGNTALAHVAAGGNTAGMQALLDIGCSKHVNTINNKHQTPLMIAAKHPRDNFQCLQILLDAGAGANVQDGEGYTALDYAADSGNSRCVQMLVDTGCQNNVNTTNMHGQTSLMLAARSSKDAFLCLLKLLKAGAEVDMKDDQGYTALAYAAEQGNLACVQTLINAGADVNLACVQTLINAGADVNLACVQTLINAGADVNLACVQTLINAGADVNLACVQTLINAGADVNSTDKQLCTPLMLTSNHYHSMACTCVLLKAGADINLCDSMGRTAIDRAAQRPEYVRLYKTFINENYKFHSSNLGKDILT